jgi:hypothetical protein
MGSKSPPVILMMVTLVCGIIPAVGAVQPPSAFAQQERASLGEEESLGASIVSNVLNGVDGDDKQIGDAHHEGNQDATVTVTLSRNQEHNGNEDIIGGFANDTAHLTAEQHAGNISAPLTLSIDTTAAEEEKSTPSPQDDAQE